jgi:plasmid stabilization system protein ParE
VAQVRWTIGARADLREIVEFIARDSGTYATVTADRILNAVERLERHSRLGRVVPEYRSSRLRELIVGRHRVVYWVSVRDVTVLAVVDASRDLLRRLGDQPWRIR